MAGFNRFQKSMKVWLDNWAFSLKTKHTKSNNKKAPGRQTKKTSEETATLEIKTNHSQTILNYNASDRAVEVFISGWQSR